MHFVTLCLLPRPNKVKADQCIITGCYFVILFSIDTSILVRDYCQMGRFNNDK